MRLAVLDFTTPYPGMEDRPTAGEMIVGWLAPFLPEAELQIVDIAGGAAMPGHDAFDGFVLSGSEKGVYDDTPWMLPLRAWLREARELRTPMLGICFGHQVMADVYGGRAEKVGYGLVCGSRTFDFGGRDRDFFVWHQDQVTVVPDCARVIGGAAYCPAGIIEYDFPALTAQFHPEYTDEFLAFEVRTVAGQALDPALAEAALVSIASGAVEEGAFGAEAAVFFRTHLAAVDTGLQVA